MARNPSKAMVWLVALCVGALVGVLLGGLTDMPPGVVGGLALLVMLGTVLVGGRVWKAGARVKESAEGANEEQE